LPRLAVLLSWPLNWFFFFFETASCFVAQAGLKFSLPASAFWVLELPACTTLSQSYLLFFKPCWNQVSNSVADSQPSALLFFLLSFLLIIYKLKLLFSTCYMPVTITNGDTELGTVPTSGNLELYWENSILLQTMWNQMRTYLSQGNGW
jgi:hypothetical protein